MKEEIKEVQDREERSVRAELVRAARAWALARVAWASEMRRLTSHDEQVAAELDRRMADDHVSEDGDDRRGADLLARRSESVAEEERSRRAMDARLAELTRAAERSIEAGDPAQARIADRVLDVSVICVVCGKPMRVESHPALMLGGRVIYGLVLALECACGRRLGVLPVPIMTPREAGGSYTSSDLVPLDPGEIGKLGRGLIAEGEDWIAVATWVRGRRR